MTAPESRPTPGEPTPAPCPWCGGPVHVADNEEVTWTAAWVVCDKVPGCEVGGPVAKCRTTAEARRDAIAAWNRIASRVAAPAAPGDGERALTPEERAHRGEHLRRTLREWAADQREREGWKDADRSTYHYCAMALEGALAELSALAASREQAEQELYTERMTCAVCGQYGDGCNCGGVVGLRARAEQSAATVDALRRALCGLMGIDGSPESLALMRVGIVQNAGSAPDKETAEAAMRAVEALERAAANTPEGGTT
jgi:hypothetical protein